MRLNTIQDTVKIHGFKFFEWIIIFMRKIQAQKRPRTFSTPYPYTISVNEKSLPNNNLLNFSDYIIM